MQAGTLELASDTALMQWDWVHEFSETDDVSGANGDAYTVRMKPDVIADENTLDFKMDSDVALMGWDWRTDWAGGESDADLDAWFARKS